jgi:D-sedoheptulose 7-phosphate isomerase
MFAEYIIGLKKVLTDIRADISGQPATTESAVEEMLQFLRDVKKSEKQLFWVGNGGSAALAGHSALDYFRTAGFKSLAFNDGPLLTCLGNDFGYADVFSRPLSLYAGKDDLLVAISSSGKSENILRAVAAAREKGCRVVTLSGFAPDNPLRRQGDVAFYAPSGGYGYVELVHGILCHSFLDLFMQRERGGTLG